MRPSALLAALVVFLPLPASAEVSAPARSVGAEPAPPAPEEAPDAELPVQPAPEAELAPVLLAPDAQPAPSSDAEPDPHVPVRFEADRPHVRVYVFGDDARHVLVDGVSFGDVFEDGYNLVCRAPCDVRLRPGQYRLALGYGRPIPVREPLFVGGRALVHASVRDRRPVRTIGWFLAGLASAASMTFFGMAIGYSFLEPEEMTASYWAVGGAIAGAVTLAGVVLGVLPHRARVVVEDL